MSFEDRLNVILFIFSGGCIVAFTEWHRRVFAELALKSQTLKTLTEELEHRGKNTFAVIDVIVRNTLKNDPRADDISGRIRAVKYINDLITNSSKQKVLLRTLLMHEFSPYQDRCTTEGEDAWLDAHAARQLALVLHELTTNAAKYGALSQATGRVLINWTQQSEGVKLMWCETGGPVVTQPERAGFGSKLLAVCLKSLSGSIENEYPPEGYRCTIVFQLNSLTKNQMRRAS